MLLSQQEKAEKPIQRNRLNQIERATLEAFNFDEMEVPSPDEVLRQAGLYDSTDKRNCVNRKRR
jgi:hypothetical protein